MTPFTSEEAGSTQNHWPRPHLLKIQSSQANQKISPVATCHVAEDTGDLCFDQSTSSTEPDALEKIIRQV